MQSVEEIVVDLNKRGYYANILQKKPGEGLGWYVGIYYAGRHDSTQRWHASGDGPTIETALVAAVCDLESPRRSRTPILPQRKAARSTPQGTIEDML